MWPQTAYQSLFNLYIWTYYFKQLPGKWLLCIDRSVPFPAIELGRDILLGIVVTADETWFTGLDGTTDAGGDAGALSTWFCCEPAATA